MEYTFLYVFDKDARDALAKMGFQLFQSDDRQNIYVFLNSLALDANAAGVAFIESDSLIM